MAERDQERDQERDLEQDQERDQDQSQNVPPSTIRYKKGDWVEVHSVVLRADQRSKDVPQDTSKVPLESWIRGWALEEGAVGQEIAIETASGRKVKGILTSADPGYSHTYGPTVPELAPIGRELRAILREGKRGGHDG